MQLTCPCCHSHFPLDAANQDESARELLALKGKLAPRLWTPLIAYLGLFRSKTRSLAWDRAVRLAREIMELDAEPERLETALYETVEALRFKAGPPLTNHNYLKKVLATKGSASSPVPMRAADTVTPSGKRATAIVALQEWAGGDWLRCEISAGLQALVAQSLKYQPGADVITMNADVWFVALKKELTIQAIDTPRIRKGFEKLFREVTEWPAPRQLRDLLPSRPPRRSLPEPEPTEEDNEAGRRGLEGLMKYRTEGQRAE